ncbi:MAG: hypothetical protein DRQ51_04080 [Gammaproteobacteria bacterium]|nr:MAG: hypothetical protein DRQ51_04080 [Gammaproteobacteria bacterium]
MNEKIEQLSQDISESNEINPHVIDVDLIESHSKIVVNLLNGNETTSEILHNRYYHFKFKEPIYIHEIMFVPEDGTNLLGLEVTSTDFKDEESTIIFSKKEHVTALPRKVIKEFKIKPKKRLLQQAKLKKIELTGFLVDELDSVKNKVKEVAKYKVDLQKKLDELVEKNNDFKAKENTLNALNENIPKLKENKAELENAMSKLEAQRTLSKEDNQTLKDSTAQLQAKSDNLNLEISTNKQNLKKLIADKNIFSTEMKEYIKQANQHIRTYFFLAFIPWFLIACISYLLFNNAADLSAIYNTTDGVDIFAIFWTRLPFAIITISILFVSYEISKVFVQNMMKIQSQKRIFAKIGIVAKDVADSSVLELKDLSDSDKYELRIRLKMDLLKAHLSNDIGEDYEYKIKTSLISHLLKLYNKQPNKKQ